MKTNSVIREIYLPMILTEKEPKDFYQQGYRKRNERNSLDS